MPNSLITISSAGISVDLSPLGAAVRSVRVPDRNGRMTEVSLAARNEEAGFPDPSLSGRIVAPSCGRVRASEINIDGELFSLAKNEGVNHLHGGPSGGAFREWDVLSREPNSVLFSLMLPDWLDGYPGNRWLIAHYKVEDGILALSMGAITDAVTWIGMTSHLYWDLTGSFDGSALDQQLEISADRVVYNDREHLPVSVERTGGPFDFSGPSRISDRMRAFPKDEQLMIGRGYNNAFLLKGSSPFAARLYAPSTGIRMTLKTDQPALVFYSGGFLGSDTLLESGGACPGCAVALEAQHLPDPFHLPGASPELLRPGERYLRSITWRFEAV